MAGARISDRDNWFDIWFEDKKSILDIMAKNMADDLKAGYDYFGKSMTTQRKEIAEYKAKFDAQLDEFKNMDEKAVNRWCFYELKKTGAIE